MRFRSLVVSWCVCAIHGSLQTSSSPSPTSVSGHRSLDETSSSSRKSTRHPLVDAEIPPDILLERSPRNVPGKSSAPPSSYHPLSPNPSRTDDDGISPDRFVLKRDSSRRKRKRKRCNRRKQNARRRIIRPGKVKFADDRIAEKEEEEEESTSSTESSGVAKNPSTGIDAIVIIPTSTLNPTSELTTGSSTMQHFLDIADATTTDAVPSTTTIVAKVVDDTNTREKTYQRNHAPRKKCKGKKKKNVIDALEGEFFPSDFEKPYGSSRTPSSSSSKDVNLSAAHRRID